MARADFTRCKQQDADKEQDKCAALPHEPKINLHDKATVKVAFWLPNKL